MFRAAANRLVIRIKSEYAVVCRAGLREYLLGAVLWLFYSPAHASFFSSKLCMGFKSIADNTLYSIVAGVGLAGLLVANSLDEGDNKVKSTVLKIGIAGTGLVNLETISTLVTGSGWGC